VSRILNQISKNKINEVNNIKKVINIKYIISRIKDFSYNSKDFFYKNLQGNNNIIAECKKGSPSAGIICKEYNPASIALSYEKLGASAISVLTDTNYFFGSIHHLIDVSKNVKLPILRKDFIVDEYQIYESKLYGAHCILLIVAILSEQQLEEYYQIAYNIGLDVIVEVHNHEELELALKYKCRIIGINNRNLQTMEVDLNTTIELAQHIKQPCIIICESGIKTIEDVEKIQNNNIGNFLIGEALMKNNTLIQDIINNKRG